MSTATDSRGVLRGRCTSCNTCVQYSRSTSDFCSVCFHPPAKHLKLDPITSTASAAGSGGVPIHQQSGDKQHYSAASALAQHVPQQYYYSYSAPLLKDCAALDCKNKVHYDPELGPFDYCSPGCRDIHLLPRERKKLMEDIEANSKNMSTYLPQSTHITPSSSSSSVSTSSGASASAKKENIVLIDKKPKENLGIITAQIPDEPGLRILGVKMGTPAVHELKAGRIKFLDIITQLNEDPIHSVKWFEQNTRDKTRPQLTLLRNHNTPSGIKPLLTKAEGKYPPATHIRVAINPTHVPNRKEFGITPLKMTTGKGETTGFYLMLSNEDHCTAQLSGITTRDKVLLYSFMNSKVITEAKTPLVEDTFKDDIKKAKADGKHLVLVLKKEPIVY